MYVPENDSILNVVWNLTSIFHEFCESLIYVRIFCFASRKHKNT